MLGVRQGGSPQLDNTHETLDVWHRVQIGQSPDEAVHISASNDERQTVGVAIRPGAQQQEGKNGDCGNRKAPSVVQGHVLTVMIVLDVSLG